jgi:hypothetical protein
MESPEERDEETPMKKVMRNLCASFEGVDCFQEWSVDAISFILQANPDRMKMADCLYKTCAKVFGGKIQK